MPQRRLLQVRPTRVDDIPALTQFLNSIIRRGGTTAYELPFTPDSFEAYFLTGPAVLRCLTVACGEEGGQPVGFQTLSDHPDLPFGWADIATFTRREEPVAGAGRALFSQMRIEAASLGLEAINASIRADNLGGLAFYRGLGFAHYATSEAQPLRDGTLVDRLHHKLIL